jgi:hypothetical protein
VVVPVISVNIGANTVADGISGSGVRVELEVWVGTVSSLVEVKALIVPEATEGVPPSGGISVGESVDSAP